MASVSRTEDLLPHDAVGLVAVPDRGLGEAPEGDLGRNVGATQRRTGDAEALLDDIGEDVDVGARDVDALDE